MNDIEYLDRCPMPDKLKPIGICDYCDAPILADWYTAAGTPRLYCSGSCRGKAISQEARAVISRKAKQRVAKGEWINPASIHAPAPERIGEGVRRVKLRRVIEAEPQRPALAGAARQVLAVGKPQDPVLRGALAREAMGTQFADLEPAEQAAIGAYRAELAVARRAYRRTWKRERYKAQQAVRTDDQQATQRAQWRAAAQRYRARKRQA